MSRQYHLGIYIDQFSELFLQRVIIMYLHTNG